MTPCFDRACALLAQRPHFRAELAAKLERRGYPRAEIDATLDRLLTAGYLDDEAAARGFIAARATRGAGRLRLRAELERRGAAPAAIEAALGELPDDDRPAAREAAARWRPTGTSEPRAALARHLERKGFSRRAIFAVLTERFSATDADEES